MPTLIGVRRFLADDNRRDELGGQIGSAKGDTSAFDDSGWHY